ncbi:MAG: hypothetical protein JWR34_4490 [Mycobacterium sp.]|nr:hypothetical protein [Mycobacterium sp.]
MPTAWPSSRRTGRTCGHAAWAKPWRTDPGPFSVSTVGNRDPPDRGLVVGRLSTRVLRRGGRRRVGHAQVWLRDRLHQHAWGTRPVTARLRDERRVRRSGNPVSGGRGADGEGESDGQGVGIPGLRRAQRHRELPRRHVAQRSVRHRPRLAWGWGVSGDRGRQCGGHSRNAGVSAGRCVADLPRGGLCARRAGSGVSSRFDLRPIANRPADRHLGARQRVLDHVWQALTAVYFLRFHSERIEAQAAA